MKIDKLTRLFEVLGRPAEASQKSNPQTSASQETKAIEAQKAAAQPAPEPAAAQAEAAASAAVFLARDFGIENDEVSRKARGKKVSRLKEAVASGEYKPDRQEVAKAVARELLV